MSERRPLSAFLPEGPASAEALLDRFLAWCAEAGFELYPAQEEALLELWAGRHVVLATPTGSGKSLVALGLHFKALAEGRTSFYTSPIKALASEKFFALCDELGAERVGMLTGDASINPEAKVLCCTAEVLANMTLRSGPLLDAPEVVMDEFHYYSDAERGWAWQVPLVSLPKTRFLLMSATLGDMTGIARRVEQATGREAALVTSSVRPVPLDFEWRETPLHETIEELLRRRLAPVYVVSFTQRDCAELAQALTSQPMTTREEREAIREAVGDFRFDTPYGKEIRRYVSFGVGLHHAGLLPKYRLLVEQLSQQGLLKVICGTDTLGVGVNIPIRTVLFSKLAKFDGEKIGILSVRDFQQIAGRAGRRGFDDRGDVWVQAPEHVVENERMAKAAETDAKKRKKLVKKKPPERGFVHWSQDTFDKLVNGSPEPLTSSFGVNHQMVMSLLDRPGDGCGAVRRLMTDNHETRQRQRQHIRRAIAIYRSLVDADLLEFPDPPDELGRRVRVNFDLQDEFALHQPLSLWAIDAIGHLDRQIEVQRTEATESSEPTGSSELAESSGVADQLGDEAGDAEPATVSTGAHGDVDRALAVLTIIEAVQENPSVVIAAQVRKVKDELMSEMKSAGVEYEER
ncbi:MAG TPA: DUF3516 domain-containing protein, partial [Thermoanaerobaculia bacterium]|nr:DUF3516 domain-containing protein [Thermoanaerobaculia bacterium]